MLSPFYIYLITIIKFNQVKTFDTQLIDDKVNTLNSLRTSTDEHVFDTPRANPRSLTPMASSLHQTIVPYEKVGPDMMMYDDFTNEDVGNVIMDADYGNNTLLDTDDEHAVFRSIRPERLIGRKNRRKRKRNKNKAGVSRRRPGFQNNRPQIQYQEEYKKTPYQKKLSKHNNRPIIKGLERRRPNPGPKKSELHRRGQYETRRRLPEHSRNKDPLHNNNVPSKFNKDDSRYDNSRYAEYEISESSKLKENDYHVYESSFPNEDEDDDSYFDDFTPYIEEQNGLKIPILPAANPANHVPPKKYKLIPHRRPLILGHSPVVGRVTIPKRSYNHNRGTRRGPLISGHNLYQGRLNSQRVISQIKKDRYRAGNSIANNLTGDNEQLALHLAGGAGSSRRNRFNEERRKNKRIRNNKRQHGSRVNNRIHPSGSPRRRRRRKQHRDSLRNEHHNQYQDDISEDTSSIRDDYNDDKRGFKPSQPLVGVVTPTSNYHSDYNTNYLPQNTEREELNQYSYSKQNNKLSHPQTDIDFNMERFMDNPKDGEGFFHGMPENFPSLSDLVGEFSENKEKSTSQKLTHMVNYQRNDDGSVTAKLEEGRQQY